MSGLKIKQEWMQKTVVVWFGALLCCLLWGSAFPCIKIGYRLFEVDAADTASQILYRSSECIYCDSGSRIFVSSGKNHIKKNHRLYSGICRSSID